MYVAELAERAYPTSIILTVSFRSSRRVYSKAIAAAGTDFRSDKLWDMYINFEKDKKDWQRVTKIYDQLLTIPTQLYSHHFEK